MHRDYDQVVLASHFPLGWLAPKYITPENSYLVNDIYAVSGAPLDPLLGELQLGQHDSMHADHPQAVSMYEADMHSWTLDAQPTALFGYMLFYYLTGNVLWL